jgi:5,10-methylene-tetrahydrofolate dehydrogenase/methenyl tetrahydrofolate cyclohydrolase
VTSLGFGRLALGAVAYGSATPAGVMALLAHYHIDVAGRNAVVIGRSPILGKPMAMMLLNANPTVTICHSKTLGLKEHSYGKSRMLVVRHLHPFWIQTPGVWPNLKSVAWSGLGL